MTKSFLNSQEIKELIPHRYPFLFVDKIQSLIPDFEIVGIKNLSINEEIFQGHFPQESIFPGVLSVEACAQTAGILCAYSNLLKLNNIISEATFEEKAFNFLNKEELPSLNFLKSKLENSKKSQIFYLTTIDETKFRKPMIPGAQLFIKIKVIQKRSVMWKFSGEIWIDDQELAMQTSFSAFLKQD